MSLAGPGSRFKANHLGASNENTSSEQPLRVDAEIMRCVEFTPFSIVAGLSAEGIQSRRRRSPKIIAPPTNSAIAAPGSGIAVNTTSRPLSAAYEIWNI
jgi:hypothetical protein